MENQREDAYLGKALKFIREKKGISSKDFAKSMKLSSTKLSKIENGQQMLSADSLIRALSFLNIYYEEFILLLDTEDSFKARVETKNDFERLINQGSAQYAQTMLAKAQENRKAYKDSYFQHIYCILNSQLIFDTTHDFETTRSALEPIREYLSSIESWFEYEIALFANCYCLFPIEDAIKLGNEALTKMKDYSTSTKYNEISHNLFLGLATYALSDANFYDYAINFADKAFSSAAAKPMYTALMTHIIKQIAYYKKQSLHYSKSQLVNIIEGLELMGFDEYAHFVLDLLQKHGITLENVEK